MIIEARRLPGGAEKKSERLEVWVGGRRLNREVSKVKGETRQARAERKRSRRRMNRKGPINNVKK